MTVLARFATALRVVLAAALTVLGAGAVVRGITAAFDPFEPYPGHASDYGVERTRAARAMIPEIAARDEPTVIVLGSSGIARAFVPAAFDAAARADGDAVTSHDLAQLLAQPETLRAMARVIRSTYEARGRRMRMAILGVSVPELARAGVRAARRLMPDQPFAFTTLRGLAERAHVDPSAALTDGLSFAIFGDVRPARVGQWLEDAARPKPWRCESGMRQPPVGDEARAAMDAFCAELRRQRPAGLPAFDRAARGGYTFGLPETRPLLERLASLQAAWAVEPPPLPADPIPARDDLDEDGLRLLADAARDLAAVSDTTVVLSDLLNPVLVAPLPPSRFAQWREAAERIARDGGATLVDPNDGSLRATDFGDRTHLSPLAAERFSTELWPRLHALERGRDAPR